MGPRWKGHRLFAVDGTKLNLPRPLVAAGYRTPSDNAYSQGLLSCLYRLRSRIPVDFDLVAHADERKAALSHLDALADNAWWCTSYFSRALLCAHIARGRIRCSGFRRTPTARRPRSSRATTPTGWSRSAPGRAAREAAARPRCAW